MLQASSVPWHWPHCCHWGWVALAGFCGIRALPQGCEESFGLWEPLQGCCEIAALWHHRVGLKH